MKMFKIKFMYTTIKIACCIAAVGLTACATQNRYEGVKAGAEENCNKLPVSARLECWDKINKQSYDQYEKERERLKKK